jgi:hypothetical protein
MSTPQVPEGAKQAANVQVGMAIDALEQALMGFGAETEEGQTILAALKGLSGKFGAQKQQAKNLVPAELQMLMSAFGGGPKAPVPPPPGPPAPGGAPPMA